MSKNTRFQLGRIKDIPRANEKFIDIKARGNLPAKVDLRQSMPSVYDQLSLGSCVANFAGALYQYIGIKQNKSKSFIPSRLYIYYYARLLLGNGKSTYLQVDSGASIQDGVDALYKYGCCPENGTINFRNCWRYVVRDFKRKPSSNLDEIANTHKSVEYLRVEQSESNIKTLLANGYPIMFGIDVYASFFDKEIKGAIPIPDINKEQYEGGHAIVICGYDDKYKFPASFEVPSGAYIIRNSWGAKYGDSGHNYLPYSYVHSKILSSDFWTIKSTSDREML